jgi:ribonuclease P protein component
MRDASADTRRSDTRLRPSDRIRKTWEFRTVYDHGNVHYGTRVVVHGLRVMEGSSRVGVVAGKRVGDAHARNRAKRLLREAYRQSRELLPEGPTWIVLISRKSAATATYAAVRGDLEKAYMALFGRGESGT